MRKRTGTQTAHPAPARSCPPPAAHSQHDERHDRNGHPEDDHETSLDACIAPVVDPTPPLSRQQRSAAPPAPAPPQVAARTHGSQRQGPSLTAGISDSVRLPPADLDMAGSNGRRAPRPASAA